MGQLAVPMLIGAGVGAVGGAAMGKNPFKTALLGAGVGATGGAAGLFGGGAAAGAGATAGTVGTTGEIGGSLLSTAGGLGGGSVALPAATSGALTSPSILAGQGSNLTGAGMLGSVNNAASVTPSLLSGAGMTTASGQIASGAVPLTMMDKVGNYVSNLPSQAMDWAKNNPISATKMAVDVATPAPEQPIQQSQGQIRQGNPQALYMPQWDTNVSSPTYNTSPSIMPKDDSKIGLLSVLQSRIPLTDEEKLRLMQLGQRF